MNAVFYSKVRNRDLFIYEIDGTDEEIAQFKNVLGENYRSNEDGKALFFTKFYSGPKQTLVLYNGKYMIDLKKLIFLESDFKNAKQNLWKIIDHSVSKDPRLSKVSDFWSSNRNNFEQFNNSIHVLPKNLKLSLFKAMHAYGISISDHVKLNPEELIERIENIEEQEETLRDVLREANDDAYYSRTNWSNYDDNLDMRQQSQDFWDQF